MYINSCCYNTGTCKTPAMINICMRKVLDNFYVILNKKEYIKLQQIYMKYNKMPVGIETRYRYISDTLFWFISKLYTVMIWKTHTSIWV